MSSGSKEQLVLREGRAPATLRRLPALEAAMRVGHWLSRHGVDMDGGLLDEVLDRAGAAEFFEVDAAGREGLAGWLAACVEVDLAVERAGVAKGKAPVVDGDRVDALLWRRAEGVTVAWDLEADAAPVLRLARAGNEESSASLAIPKDALRLLTALHTWERPAAIAERVRMPEADVVAWLDVFARHDLAAFSSFDCARTFPTTLAALGEKPLALVDAVGVDALFDTGRGPEERILMPRMGELDESYACGVSFSTMRRGHRVACVRLFGGRRTFAALRAVLPLLDGTRNAREILRATGAGSGEEVARVLDAMCTTGLLQSPPREEARARPETCPTGAAYATWLGHASVMLSVDDAHVWIDPSLPLGSHQPRHGVKAPLHRQLPKPSAVFITHGDNDHLCPPWLLRLPTTTPVHFPSTEGAGPFQVDMAALLTALGFTELRPMNVGDRVRIGGERGSMTVTAAPFEGEDWGLPLRSLTYLVEVGGKRVYLSADAAGMLEHAASLAEAASGAIDLALLGVSDCVEPHVAPLGYGNFYDRHLPAERRMRLLRLTNGPQQSAALAKAIGAKAVFGYAAGTPQLLEMAYGDEGTHDELARILLERGGREGGSRPVNLALGVPWRIE